MTDARPFRPLLPLLALTLLAVPALAGVPWGEGSRELRARSDAAGFQMTSTRNDAEHADVLEARYGLSDATLRVSLQTTEPDAMVLEAAVALHALTEFEDLDADGRFGLGDRVVQRIPVAGSPALTYTERLDDGGWRAAALHSLPTRQGTPARVHVLLEATPTPRESALDGATQPAHFLLSVDVQGIASAPGTLLALEAAFASADAPEASGDGAAVAAGAYELGARWLETGAGDVLAGGDERSVLFVRSAPSASHATYAAEVGAAYAPSSAGGGLATPPGSLPIYLLAAAGCLLLFALPAWMRLRGPA